MGFSGGSAGKESTCSAGEPGSISGSGRSAGGGTGYPLQHSWASPVPQLVNKFPAMWGTWVRSLGWEDPLEKGKAIHSSILAWRIPWTVQPQSHKESDTTEGLSAELSSCEKDLRLISLKCLLPGPLEKRFVLFNHWGSFKTVQR